MTRYGNSACFDLSGSNPTRLKSLKPIFTEGQSGTPVGLTPHPASMLFAVFDFLWHKHD
jgi:hypothetical protein